MVKGEIKVGNVKVLVNDEYVVREDEVGEVLEEVGKYASVKINTDKNIIQ